MGQGKAIQGAKLTAHDVVAGARNLLSDPKHLCRGASARSWRGKPVDPSDEQAASWCVYGAISRVAAGNKKASTKACELIEGHLREHRRSSNVAEFSDTATHAEVLDLLAFNLPLLRQVHVV